MTAPENRSTRMIGLRCGHRVLFAQPYPAHGEALWCVRCDAGSTAVDTPHRTPADQKRCA